MISSSPQLALPLFVAAGLAIVSLAACDATDRTEEFAAAGAAFDLEVREDLPEAHAAAIRALPSIAFHDQSFFPRVLSGRDVLVFDWVWRDDRLKDRERGAQTVFAIRIEGARMPPFVLAARGALSSAAEREGGGVVPFTTPERWLDRYVLVSRARGPARALFPSEVRATFELPRGARLEGSGEWIVLYRPGRLASPAAFEWELGDLRLLVAPWTER